MKHNIILEQISDGFFALDRSWNFTYVNKEAEAFFAKDRKELLNNNIWSLFPLAIGSKFQQDLTKAMTATTPLEFEHQGLKTGKFYWGKTYPSEEGVSVYFSEITDRKRTEKELARLDRLNLIGQMSAGISHEIRNPLTTIKGFLQLLAERQEYHKDLTYFKLMIQEIDRANSIITEFLSLGKTKAGEAKLINLNDVLLAMEPLITTQALNVDLTIKFEKNAIPHLLLDEKEIRQLILNLVRNGIEAMVHVRKGYLTIKTFVEKDDVVLAFVDQGPGIPEEVLKKIGTPFYSTKENGTGLGIAVCNSIIQHYQGKIHYTTSEAGTIFYVRLPIKYNNHL